MTAGWRRGSISSGRRWTVRSVVVVVAVVVLAVIIAEVAADVVNSGSVADRVEAQTYVTEVIPVVDESVTLAATMHIVRDGGASLDRTSLERALGDLVEGTSENFAQLGTLGVPAPRLRSGQLLAATLEARAQGSRDTSRGRSLSPLARTRAPALSPKPPQASCGQAGSSWPRTAITDSSCARCHARADEDAFPPRYGCSTRPHGPRRRRHLS